MNLNLFAMQRGSISREQAESIMCTVLLKELQWCKEQLYSVVHSLSQHIVLINLCWKGFKVDIIDCQKFVGH